jgi:aspartokinase
MRAGIPIDGLSLAGGLVEARLCKPSGPTEEVRDFVRLLARHRINMNLFVGTLVDGVNIVSCIADTEGNRLKDLTGSIRGFGGEIKLSGPVGLISLFPHRSSLKVVGSAVTALVRAHIPLGGFCSSLSAVTFIIDRAHQEKALSTLAECFRISSAQVFSR